MNRWSDVVFLIDLVSGQDKDGFSTVVPGIPRQVFADKKSVRSSEFHAAKQQGITLVYMFDVRTEEFKGEGRLTYKGSTYSIYRTYEKGEFIELVCQRQDDNHAS